MKQAFALLLAIVTCSFNLAFSKETPELGVPYARNLQKDGALSKQKNGIVLVMFSGAHCTYCATVLNEFLVPMSRNADYQAKLVMRKVEISSTSELKDFQGANIPQRQFAGKYGITMVPSVMAFDSEGKPLGKPVVGLGTIDYYGYHLDQMIDKAIAQVRGLPEPR